MKGRINLRISFRPGDVVTWMDAGLTYFGYVEKATPHRINVFIRGTVFMRIFTRRWRNGVFKLENSSTGMLKHFTGAKLRLVTTFPSVDEEAITEVK